MVPYKFCLCRLKIQDGWLPSQGKFNIRPYGKNILKFLNLVSFNSKHVLWMVVHYMCEFFFCVYWKSKIVYKNCKQFRLEIKTRSSPSYSCTFVLKQVLVFGEKRFIHIPIVKQCHVKSANLDFHKGNENDNPMT
jgi:hypothetical protein